MLHVGIWQPVFTFNTGAASAEICPSVKKQTFFLTHKNPCSFMAMIKGSSIYILLHYTDVHTRTTYNSHAYWSKDTCSLNRLHVGVIVIISIVLAV